MNKLSELLCDEILRCPKFVGASSCKPEIRLAESSQKPGHLCGGHGGSERAMILLNYFGCSTHLSFKL